MPIRIPDGLPSADILSGENIFVMNRRRAVSQDIRPLRIAIFNIMPTKLKTETQLLRMLSNTPLQVEITLLHPYTYQCTHTSAAHLDEFYKTFPDIARQKFDGLIITGAPVEQLQFDDVQYWVELTELLDWSKTHVYSTLHICWGAQAGLYHHYGVPKYPLEKKLSGVFPHRVIGRNIPLFRGFDDVFSLPHSRYTEIRQADIDDKPLLHTVADSEEAGVCIVMRRDGRQIFITGHGEYEADTLAEEYRRDLQKGLPEVTVPRHYFAENDPAKPPLVNWRAHATLLFTNWLNYYVYQETPFDLNKLENW
ncbi:MAG: homoserine O-succinyltransferase [Oscillospiraceae bacterium]|jgi:homoserine O-succinyltransferase|nr:homoserine O-succinyltransferase [Oscillospiraceae bacterium]